MRPIVILNYVHRLRYFGIPNTRYRGLYLKDAPVRGVIGEENTIYNGCRGYIIQLPMLRETRG